MAASDTIAIALVVESSLALAAEWHRVIAEYVSHMLKRLDETHPSYKFRMAFVTYATADTRPSPLLCKRFFADVQQVTKEIREEPGKLGIGHTTSGGSKGMAALEGLVAAIELFDILRNDCPPRDPARPHVHCIFHVAASPADNSEHPQWNDSPTLDNVTWDTLPSELKKRNINLSSINLRPQLPRFAELHSSATLGTAVPPWFPFRAPHSLLLAGFPVPTQQKPGKRVGEIQNEPTSDAKRPRTSQHSIEASPKVAIAIAASTQSQPSTQPQSQPPTQHQPQPPAPLPQPVAVQPPQQQQNPLPSRISQQQIMEHIRRAEDQLRNLDSAIKNARAAGNAQLAESLTHDWAKKNMSHQKFKQAVASYAQNPHMMAARQQAQAHSQGQNQGLKDDGDKALGSTPEHSTMPAQMQPSPVHTHKETGGPIFGSDNNNNSENSNTNVFPWTNKGPLSEPARAQLPHNRSMSSSGFPQRPNSSPNQNMNASSAPGQLQGLPGAPPAMRMSPNVAVQMQKLIEQQRNRPLQNLGGGMGTMSQNPKPNQNVAYPEIGSGPSSVGANLGQRQPQPEVGQAAAQPRGPEQKGGSGGKPTSSAVWQGALSWTGFDAQGKKDVRTFVVASTHHSTECRADTWPATLTLSPAREPSVPMIDLQSWMKRHKPVLCTFQAQPRVLDTKANEGHYRSLVQLLTVKNIYAVAGWTLPSGAQENNALVFPINGVGLVGAFFPLTGIPEMPKSSGGAMNIGAMNLPPEIVTQLQRLTPPQRNLVLAQILQRQQQQQHQQQQQQQDPSGLLPFNLNAQPPGGYANTNGLLGMLGSQAGGGNNLNATNLSQQAIMGTGLSRPVSEGVQGGIGGNVSYEMLQSFMQRNLEGGSAMGPG